MINLIHDLVSFVFRDLVFSMFGEHISVSSHQFGKLYY